MYSTVKALSSTTGFKLEYKEYSLTVPVLAEATCNTIWQIQVVRFDYKARSKSCDLLISCAWQVLQAIDFGPSILSMQGMFMVWKANFVSHQRLSGDK